MRDRAGYSISSHGQIRNDRTGVIRKQLATGRYRRVTLNTTPVYVHREVLRAFVGEPEPGQVCRHLDGNPLNNHLSNLAWGTYKENSDDQLRHGSRHFGESHHSTYLNNDAVLKIHALRGEMTAAEVADLFGSTRRTVQNIWQGISWGWLTGVSA